jgi:hypothetical protein
VRIHRGPAAVIGDERHIRPFAGAARAVLAACEVCGEGVVSRMIRKPEDLPVIAGYMMRCLRVLRCTDRDGRGVHFS